MVSAKVKGNIQQVFTGKTRSNIRMEFLLFVVELEPDKPAREPENSSGR